MKTSKFGVLVLVILSFSYGKATPSCVDAGDKCTCFQFNELEYQCPPEDFQLNIKVAPDQYVKIFCENLTTYDMDLFPRVNASKADLFVMSYCPLPDFPFTKILKKFNMQNSIKWLEFETDGDHISVTKDVFEGLNQLDTLAISYSHLLIKNNFLSNTPNLKKLMLPKNDLKQIGYIFNYTSNLMLLDLSRNNLLEIQDNVFQSLQDLQLLHLWSNNISRISNKTFSGLRNLRLLELSRNKIETIDSGGLSHLTNLVNVSFKNNNIKFIHSDLFKHNRQVENVRFGSNLNLILPELLFENLTKLKCVYIDNSQISLIPASTFKGCVNLDEVSLAKNNITVIPEGLFKGIKTITKINLSFNEIINLPSDLFSGLTILETLYLQHNRMQQINKDLFSGLTKLKVLNLSNNKIKTIHLNAFSDLHYLEEINLSFNHWSNTYGLNFENINPLNSCLKLKTVNLRSNLLREFPTSLLQSQVRLKKLDLAYNRISEIMMSDFFSVSDGALEIDLSANNITYINFQYTETSPSLKTSDAIHNHLPQTVIVLNNNSIPCDCYLYDLIRFNNYMMHPGLNAMFHIVQDHLTCTGSQPVKFVKDVKPQFVSCLLNATMGCPDQCVCDWKPYDSSITIDCSKKNLTSVPKIDMEYFDRNYERFAYKYNQTYVNLADNILRVGPDGYSGYENVTSLDLSGNLLTNISWIPHNVKVLKLNCNNLEEISSDFVEILKNTSSLQRFTLYNNPWRCQCSSVDLQKFLMTYYEKVDPNDVVCQDTGKHLVDIKDLCEISTAAIVCIAVSLSLLLLLATFLAIYYRFQTEIKIYLYAKNLCLWLVTEEELDKDKTYDIFVSYSHKDEEFVTKKLMPVLEQGPKPFKVCIHYRNWRPGQFIAKQVTESVLDSRRTLVILSNNFIESVWGKMEFRTAHSQAISDGRARVIVVIYGEFNEDLLDDELRAYLKTNTYVKWGDPWFWQKLRFALPHSKLSFYNSNKKHANIMLKIDDKYDLVTKAPSSNNLSTPPVLLNPILLDETKLAATVIAQNANTVPEGETPLLIK